MSGQKSKIEIEKLKMIKTINRFFLILLIFISFLATSLCGCSVNLTRETSQTGVSYNNKDKGEDSKQPNQDNYSSDTNAIDNSSAPESASIANSSVREDGLITISEYFNQPEDVMFYSEDVSFAFIYPQDKVALSSNPYIKNEKPPFLLSVDIAPEGEDELPMDYNLAYQPSIKSYEISGTRLTEYIVFSRYDVCDVAFERTAVFKNSNYQVVIKISGDSQAITGSMPGYFIIDGANCSQEQLVWDFEKQDDFYNKLVTNEAAGVAQSWYDAFNKVLDLLQINEFKGASAGHNRLMDKRIFESDQEQNYIISVSYPEFQPAESENLNDSLNKQIYKDTISNTIDAFKEEIRQYETNSAGNKDSSDFLWQYTLSMDYVVVTYSNNLISMFLDINPYMGGAHGMNYFSTFNYDLKKNKTLNLEDVFIQGFNYLSFLSGNCFNEIKGQLIESGIEPDMQWIKEGTDPAVKDNFSNFLLVSDGLILKFPAYQVAPGAAGDFSVLIPFNENMNFYK